MIKTTNTKEIPLDISAYNSINISIQPIDSHCFLISIIGYTKSPYLCKTTKMMSNIKTLYQPQLIDVDKEK